MTDPELITAVLAGDRERFGELVGKYQGMAYGLAWHLLGDHADAQDAAQQAFVAAYTRLDQLTDRDRFGGWLRRIVVNECRMHGRAHRATLSWEDLPPQVDPSASSPAELVERAEMRQRVHQAIAGLPESQRLAVTLFYLDGKSCDEVGRFLDVPANAIKGRLHRARAQLKEALMDTVEDVLQEQKPREEFTQSVQRVVPVRVAEPFGLSVPTGPADTVLIFAYEANVEVREGSGSALRVTGQKTLLGATTEDARARSAQVVVTAERQHDVWANAPFTGDLWYGTAKGPRVGRAAGGESGVAAAHASVTPAYVGAEREWENCKERWLADPATRDSLPALLGNDVTVVVATGNHVEGIAVPYPLEPGQEAFRSGYYADGRQGYAFGPAASVSLSIEVPPCANVVFVGAGQLTVAGLNAHLFVSSWASTFTARKVRGNVTAIQTAPTLLEEIAGDVRISDPIDHRGVDFGGGRIRRCGPVPAVKMRRLHGAVDVQCRWLNLDLAGAYGDIRVCNDFGRTRLALAEEWPAGRTADIESVAGTIDLILAAGADDRLRVGVWSESGTIDCTRWRSPEGRNNYPERMYVGTKHEMEGADVRVRTRSGGVRVVRK